ADERDHLAAAEREIRRADAALERRAGKPSDRLATRWRVGRLGLGRPGGRDLLDDAAVLQEERAVAELERPGRALLGDHDRRASHANQLQERRGPLRVELRGRLVEQEEPRLEVQGRGEA